MRVSRYVAGFICVVALAACETTPKVTSQTAPGVQMSQYQTYAFMDKLSSDKAGYTSITTQWLKSAVSRELEARGMHLAENPQLLVNLIARSHDKVQSGPSSHISVGYGRGGWGRSSYGVGVGLGDFGSDVASVTHDTLTVDLVDKASNRLVWSGSAEFVPSDKTREDGAKTVHTAVYSLFTKYPGSQMKSAAH